MCDAEDIGGDYENKNKRLCYENNKGDKVMKVQYMDREENIPFAFSGTASEMQIVLDALRDGGICGICGRVLDETDYIRSTGGDVGETLASGYHCRCGHREDFGK